jgi:hypothetical protein
MEALVDPTQGIPYDTLSGVTFTAKRLLAMPQNFRG